MCWLFFLLLLSCSIDWKAAGKEILKILELPQTLTHFISRMEGMFPLHSIPDVSFLAARIH